MEVEDFAGNRSVTLSDLYKIDRLPPQSERSWIEDEAGTILADGDQVYSNWVNGTARLTVHTGKVEDRPRSLTAVFKRYKPQLRKVKLH